MNKREYFEGFDMNSTTESKASLQVDKHTFDNSEVILHLDGGYEDRLSFKKDSVIIDDCEYLYEALPVNEHIFLITINMLKKEDPGYMIYVMDEIKKLVTKVKCDVTEVEKGSTTLTETTNLVKRKIEFGYYGGKTTIRHHFTHDLYENILETYGSPGSIIRYYVHSDTKITYYQKEWPLGGNPIDKDGVGYGEASYLYIDDGVYVITFTKHSHGNQPFMLWDSKTGRYVANFAGESRRNHHMFVMTGCGYLRKVN